MLKSILIAATAGLAATLPLSQAQAWMHGYSGGGFTHGGSAGGWNHSTSFSSQGVSHSSDYGGYDHSTQAGAGGVAGEVGRNR